MIWPGRWPLGPASCRVLSAASGWKAERRAVALVVRSRPATSWACRAQDEWSIGAYLIPSVPADCEQAAEDSRLIPLRWCSAFFVDWADSPFTWRMGSVYHHRHQTRPCWCSDEFRAKSFCPPASFLLRDIPFCADSPTWIYEYRLPVSTVAPSASREMKMLSHIVVAKSPRVTSDNTETLRQMLTLPGVCF